MRTASPLLVFALFLGTSLAAVACQICVPYPKKSAAEVLIESDTVVLARENPDRPFSFKTVDVLKGDAANTGEIDLFLDSTSRRILAAHADRSVVIVNQSVGAKAEWKRIGMADEDFGPLVHEILESAPAWEKTPRERVEFFGRYLVHDNAQIRTLAHLEIARAPYSEIKRMGDALPRNTIHAFLKNFRYMEWHALYILLLAQSDDPRDHDYILDAFQSAEKFGATSRLGAWTTAYIEIEEDKAIDFIEERYFRDSDRKPEELREVLKALSVHGTNGHTRLRDRIVAAYGVLLDNHPAMAPQVLTDLTAWKRTEFADQIARYAAKNQRSLDFNTTLRLRAYVRRAKQE